jgi:excisionase family DNA binding protein
MKRRVEILIETERLLIAGGRHAMTLRCDECAIEVRMITVDEAAILAGESARTIYGWVEAGRLHFLETPEGRLLICLNSLF